MRIWVDADACPKPIKEILFRAAERAGVELTLVANRPLATPRSPHIRTLLVGHGFDQADRRILELMEPGDLVVTGDIPLAAGALARGGQALDPRGPLFTEDNIADRLATRDLLDELRGTGLVTGGPATLGTSERRLFASHLDQLLARGIKTMLTLGALCLMTAPPASAEPKRIAIDPERSSFSARTGTAGILGFLGHPHGILATEWEANACIDPSDRTRGEARVLVKVAALRIDTPAALKSAGLERDFDEAEQRELQEKMLGPSALAAGDYPEIKFRSTALQPGKQGLALEGDLTLHGETRHVTVPLVLSGLEQGEVDVEVNFEIRLTDFGIEPESIGGVVKVADRVDLRLRIHGRLSDEACAGEDKAKAGRPG